MFRFLLLLQLFALVASRSRFAFDEEIFSDLFEMNDPNLNPGFDLEAWRDAQLDLHNHYRSLHGAPLMSRNESLTNQAQEYAETLAAENKGLVHCASRADCDNHGAGENLASAGGSTFAEVNATKAWYDEIWDYNFCYDANSNTSRRPGHAGKAIGHFTQVVWEGSTQLGMGYARTADRKKVYVVARYLNHGNIFFRYSENVKVPNYILDTFQNNCDGTNGSFTEWVGPGSCTRTCGGGIRFLTRTCTNPKPSLNGADCTGEPSQLAAQEWCNTHTCSGSQNHRDLQCTARGFTSGRHYIPGNSNECTLFCFVGGNLITRTGNVDDGTHCKSGAGVCVNGVCQDMPQYVPGTPPPDTTTPRPETTTTEPETTTTEPITTEPETTTTEPETTTMEPETTTTEPETTTTEPETTTTEPETTTTEPETTTTEPITTEPETTTTEPETTTTEPITTEPETTTMEPETTTTEPETTTTEPETTTTEPETTTTEPETTTTEPETTTTEPETTTTEPETTTTEPETTTTEPETTTTEPKTTTTEPETTTTESETTTAKPTTISTTTTPSPTPRRRIVRGRFSARIPLGQGRIFLRLPSGRYRITLRKSRRLRIIYWSRVKSVRGGNRAGRWRAIQCRSSFRCRLRAYVRPGYQREFAVSVPGRYYCRRIRGRYHCRSRWVRLLYLYRRY